MIQTRLAARGAATRAQRTLHVDAVATRAGQCALWRLSRVLGSGRWTRVYQARPRTLPADGPADYALKIVRREFERSPIAVAALKREAQVARHVSHPSLPSVLGEYLSQRPFYLVMPHLEGATLRALLGAETQRRPLRLAPAIWIARQIAEALRALHDAGWMHSDVKPENVLVSPQGHATLLDLGLARRLGSEECATSHGLAGTPAYCPPETLLPREQLAASSDVYSLGIVLFEMLVGRPPFAAADAAQLAVAHLQQAAPKLHELVPHVPADLSRLVTQLLAKDPLRRPQADEIIPRLIELEIETLGSES